MNRTYDLVGGVVDDVAVRPDHAATSEDDQAALRGGQAGYSRVMDRFHHREVQPISSKMQGMRQSRRIPESGQHDCQGSEQTTASTLRASPNCLDGRTGHSQTGSRPEEKDRGHLSRIMSGRQRPCSFFSRPATSIRLVRLHPAYDMCGGQVL